MTTIAVFGVSGALGKPVLDALSSSLVADKVSYPVKAITTKDKSSESTDKVKYVQADVVNDTDKLVEALKGVDVIISLVAATEPLAKAIGKIVLEVKPKLYIPSEFGVDYYSAPETVGHPVIDGKRQHAEAIEKAGIKTARIFTSFFKIPPVFLYVFTNHVGINQEDKTVTYTDNDTIVFSTGEDVGRVVGVVATTDPSKVQDTYRVFSSTKSVKELVKELEKEQGVTYKAETKSSKDILSSYDKNNFIECLFAWFSTDSFKKNDREVVNPGESLFKWGSW